MPKDIDPLITISEAAREIGVDRSVLGKQVRTGAVRGHDGKVRLSEALADRAANIDLSRSKRRDGRIDEFWALVAETGGSEPVIVDGQAMDYADARALKETYLARRRSVAAPSASWSTHPITAGARHAPSCAATSCSPPAAWNEAGRSLCLHCDQPSNFEGHAGFHASKLYSIRHRLRTLVAEFLAAKGDPDLMRKFVNTGLAELWEPTIGTGLDGAAFADRGETYGPDDLPDAVKVVTGFCDVQGDRLEVQLVGWGSDEESWPFLFEVIPGDPAQPQPWREIDALISREFRTHSGRPLRVHAFGIDTGGHHDAQVHSFCRRRRARRVFPCKGVARNRPIWSTHAFRSQSNDKLWPIGVDAAKDAIYGRLGITTPGPGYIHFPADDAFGPSYFEQLTSERRETRKRAGQPYTVWVLPPGRRNEALDTFVGALAVRRSLPRRIQAGLEYAVTTPVAEREASATAPAQTRHDEPPGDAEPGFRQRPRTSGGLPSRSGWLGGAGGRGWMGGSGGRGR